MELDDLATGVLVGILIGEGHFGGDGKRAQITVRMHTRHAALFAWLVATVPGSRLYGPYTHGGRSYFQWMVRGTALRDGLVPVLRKVLSPDLDAHAYARFDAMCTQYRLTAPP